MGERLRSFAQALQGDDALSQGTGECSETVRRLDCAGRGCRRCGACAWRRRARSPWTQEARRVSRRARRAALSLRKVHASWMRRAVELDRKDMGLSMSWLALQRRSEEHTSELQSRE